MSTLQDKVRGWRKLLQFTWHVCVFVSFAKKERGCRKCLNVDDIFTRPSPLTISWNGSNIPLSEFLFCTGMSKTDNNISRGRRNHWIDKKTAAGRGGGAQPESRMNVQQRGVCWQKPAGAKAMFHSGKKLGPWKTLEECEIGLSQFIQDISSLAYVA